MNPNGYISSHFSSNEDQAKKKAMESPKPENPITPPQREYTVANAKKYLTAELSLQLYGPVSDKVKEQRASICSSCKFNFKAPGMSEDIGFCKGCSCGVSDRSRLSIKVTMPDYECPKGKWGKAPGRHSRLKDRLKALLIKYLLK